MLTIGSAALLFHVDLKRTPADLDFICTTAEMQAFCNAAGVPYRPLTNAHWTAENIDGWKHVEFELIECSPSAAAYYEIKANGLATPEILYSLKRSHRFEPRQWSKHIRDYHLLKPIVQNVDTLANITKLRMATNNPVHHTPSLDKSKEAFFKDDVSNHVFEHDQMHEIMAYREKPMFTYIAVPGKVKSSKEQFFLLPYEDQLRCVLEEAYVIALERGIVPMLYEGKKLADSESALQWALMRICTTLCGGWFREFACEQFPAIWDARNKDYVKYFLTSVDEGRILRIGEKHGNKDSVGKDGDQDTRTEVAGN